MTGTRCAMLAALTAALSASTVWAQGADESWRKACDASRITLKMTDQSGPDIIRKIAEISGNAITIPAQSPWSNMRRNYTVNFDNEPFWGVMTKIAEMFPCNIGRGTGIKQEVALDWSLEPYIHPRMAFVGPARLELLSYAVTREARSSFGGNFGRTVPPRAFLQIGVDIEPRLRVLSGKITLTELSDDAGKNLLGSVSSSDPAASSASISPAGIATGSVIQSLQVDTQIPARQAKSFKIMRGKLSLTVNAPGDGFRLDLNQAVAQVQVDDVVLTLTDVSGDEQKGYVASFTVPAGVRVDYRKLGNAQLIGADGKVLDQRGGASHSKPGENGRFEVKFPWAPGFKPQAVLFPGMAPPRELEYEFEWADVPLPALNSASFVAAAGADKPAADAPVPPAPEGIPALAKLAPSHFSIKAQQMPLAGFLAEVERQTGNKVAIEGATGGPRGRPPLVVTGDYDNVEFWKGMDALCASCDLKMNYVGGMARSRDWKLSVYRNPGLSRAPAEPPAPAIVQYAGPLRLAIVGAGLKAESSMEYLAKPFSRDEVALSLSAQTWLEPRCAMFRQGAAFEEILGNGGVDFVSKSISPTASPVTAPPKDPRLKHSLNGFDQPCMSLALNAPLAQGETPSRIARLRLYCFADVIDGETFYEIPDPTVPGQKLLGCGITVRWKGLANDGPNWNTFCMGYERDGVTVRETESPLIGMGSIQALGADGKWFPIALRGGNPDKTYPLNFGFGGQASKIRIRDARGILTYADLLEFRDIPLPKLPEMP